MTPPLTLDLPLPPDALHPNASSHWRPKRAAVKSYRNEIEFTVRHILRAVPEQPIGRALILLTFRLRTVRKRDADNLTGWAKSACDGLQAAGVIVDDAELIHAPAIVCQADRPALIVELWPCTLTAEQARAVLIAAAIQPRENNG